MGTRPVFEPSDSLRDPARLAALRRTALLGTPAEEAFDRLTRLAAMLCEAPMSLVTLIDDQREFFKSAVGLPEPWASRPETPLFGSWCQHVVESGQSLIVENVREDPLLCTNLALLEFDAVAYAGIPLVTGEGYVLGSFCVIDSRPRHWTTAQLSMLEDLAATVMSEITLRTTLREQETVRQALRESEQRFRIMADGLPLAVWVHDANGQQEFVNRTFCEFFGVTVKEMRGDRWKSLVHPEDAESYVRAFADCVREHRSFRGEVRVRGADGAWRWIESWARPRFAPGDEFLGLVGASADITARKEAEEELRQSEARYRELVQNANSAIIRWKCGDGTVTFFNEHAEELFGYPAGEAIGRHVGFLIPEHESTGRDLTGLVADVAAHPEKYRETVVENICRDGRRIWMLWTNRPVPDAQGKVVEMLAIGSDITERQRVEEALQEADRRKDEFLATLAHELRNPLAPLQSGIDLLRLSRADDATAERALEMMERQMTHLVRLVDDLLDVSRITRGKVELRKRRVDLSDVIGRAVEAVDLSGRSRREVSITLPAERVFVEGDPVRLVQIVSNLLNNAIKYTDTNGRIWITAAQDRNQATISVRDDGRGIAPDMLGHVFDMFKQGDPGCGGLGIGLTLVRSLVELHGGAIEADSEAVGKGSEFIVRLPLAGPDVVNEPERRAAPANSGIAGHRVLVVDDNHDAAESLGMLLEMLGAQVRVTHDGAAALAMLDEFRPDDAFVDVGMPEMDGCEVARQIRARDSSDNMRLIAITGWGQEEDRKRVKSAGFDRHLIKPVSVEDLTRALAPAENRPGPDSPPASPH